MILVGVDPHQNQHTACAVNAATGELVGQLSVRATRPGHEQLLRWARRLGRERRFAVEDCRHVSANLERLLLARGERVARVAPRLMAAARRCSRTRGKSDAVDALAVARAALREPELPLAHLAEPERELRLLVDHREDLVGERTRICSRLRWHLHELELGQAVPARALERPKWLDRLTSELAGRAGTQAGIARELVGRCRALGEEIRRLEREIALRVSEQGPALLALFRCGPLTAAKIVGEVGDIRRFASAGKLAMHAGAAPIPASSGAHQRHRLNRSGNRQLNCALHRVAVTQGQLYPPAHALLARKQAEGKSRREALRCLKRHLANVVYRILIEISRDRDRASAPCPIPALT